MASRLQVLELVVEKARGVKTSDDRAREERPAAISIDFNTNNSTKLLSIEQISS